VNTEDEASDATSSKITAHFPKTFAKWPAERHADWPGELDVLDVFADELAILRTKPLEPEDSRKALRACSRQPAMYQN
jgi:hypothetical protein